MSTFTITTQHHTPLQLKPNSKPKPNPSQTNLSLKPKPKTKPKPNRTQTNLSLTTPPPLTDPFVLQLADTLEDSLPSSPSLHKLRHSSSQTLVSTPWPSRKDEAFRFTDTSFIKKSTLEPVSKPTQLEKSAFEATHLANLVICDGFLLSVNLGNLPDSVFVGSLSGCVDSVAKRVVELVNGFEFGDLFWSINGLGAPDVAVVYVPGGVRVDYPICLRYVSVEGGEREGKRLPLSNPRVIVVVENGGDVGIVEEFEGSGESCYWSNSVLEVVVGEGAKVKHSYVQRQSLDSVHIKWTSVRQETASSYELVEVSTGGKLSRHNLNIQQLGPDTTTELSAFHFSVGDQTQDLHSRLILDHPRAYSRQLHKCIVAHSLGQAVFDGNVQVNRFAQNTDAGQLTRSLLLEPRATVNVKPNLQIIADDVKCSHGAAISDLEESQLFYFQARGIDLETARKALVFSFGAEVIQRLPYSFVRNQVEDQVKGLLSSSN